MQKMLRFYMVPKEQWAPTHGAFAAAKLDTDLCLWLARLLRQRGSATIHVRAAVLPALLCIVLAA